MIYLDYHATTPCDPRVVEKMLPYFTTYFANASSVHHPQRALLGLAVQEARQAVAALIGGQPGEIVFTSGATEAINLALRGVAEAYPDRPRRMVVSALEHSAVLKTAEALSRQGVEVEIVDPDARGFIPPERLAKALEEPAMLVAVMAAHNEIGTIQPLQALAKVAREAGAFFFVDASQAAGKVPLDLRALSVDMAAMTAHKLYGPKGVGALWIRHERGAPAVQPLPQLTGGGQEKGWRSGTMDIPGIVGFGEAARLALVEMEAEGERLAELRGRLWQQIREGLAGGTVEVEITGGRDGEGPEPRLPHNLHLTFPGIDGAALLDALSAYAISAGSACSSAEGGGSKVVRLLGLGDRHALSALRIGLGRGSTAEALEAFGRDLIAAVRRLSPT